MLFRSAARINVQLPRYGYYLFFFLLSQTSDHSRAKLQCKIPHSLRTIKDSTHITMPPNSVDNNASSMQVISSRAQDYIHDCKFDVYGRRMATCSGDRFVRVWDLTDNGEWSLVGEWQAHRGSVSMLSWGHPEFGSLIATCGSDHEVKIFEERTNATSAASRWTAKAQLTEARKAVSCVEFAPRYWGLKLATGSADGYVTRMRWYSVVQFGIFKL